MSGGVYPRRVASCVTTATILRDQLPYNMPEQADSVSLHLPAGVNPAAQLMSKISIASPQEAVPVDRGRMREIARAVLDGEGVEDAEISLAFVDNATIHRLNKRYLDHDEPTDVLSFPLGEPNARRLSGELVIGAEVARAQAAARGHDIEAELALYVIHGLLHLCGYDDKAAAGAKEMRARERHYLATLGLPDIAEKE
jgi:probable rRNA maturation factor